MSWMQTYSGRRVDLPAPDPSTIEITDIAWGLAHQCRYAGHTVRHYSVAQHSILVSRLLGRQRHSVAIRLAGLLHDASEAYTTDLPRPMKTLLPGFVEIEDQVQAAIERRFLGLLPLADDERALIKAADNDLLKAEIFGGVLPHGAAAMAIRNPGDGHTSRQWDLEPVPEYQWREPIHPWPAERAYECFLHTFEDLRWELAGSRQPSAVSG